MLSMPDELIYINYISFAHIMLISDTESTYPWELLSGSTFKNKICHKESLWHILFLNVEPDINYHGLVDSVSEIKVTWAREI